MNIINAFYFLHIPITVRPFTYFMVYVWFKAILQYCVAFSIWEVLTSIVLPNCFIFFLKKSQLLIVLSFQKLQLPVVLYF